MLSIYAIIPARGGSKGIPNKNLSLVGGRSLIEIGVSECVKSKEISETFLSTDNVEIANEGRRFGAKVIHRPPEISSDTASSESALLHAIGEFESLGYKKPDAVLFLQVTSPLTKSSDISLACRYFTETSADSLFTASLFYHFLWKREAGKVLPINHDSGKRLRRQEISNCFMENGAFYILNTEGFIKHKYRFFGKIEMFEMDNSRSIDIDTQIDLEMANLISSKKI